MSNFIEGDNTRNGEIGKPFIVLRFLSVSWFIGITNKSCGWLYLLG